jgi:asparagine synthase (glutamine-hydrolysing)
MCGIAGIVTDGRPVDPGLLARMVDALEHRGPDGAGLHVDGRVGLGMRRLAVIDPAGGDQPLRSEDGRLVLVGNGEIYDEPALRAGLRARGHRFAGGSDLESVVHLWEERGPAALHELRGMFAIALWDARERELVLARDRVGKKPLAWALHDGTLRFGSEPRAILQDPGVPRDVDPAALDDFLVNGYVPHGRSAFSAVHRLPPGGLLRWRPGEAPRVSRWWTLDRGAELDVGIEESTELVRAALVDAVAVRLRADVPLGAFLSGGLDSSLVVAAMARAGGRVRTFSVAFDDAAFDESPHARAVAEHVGAEHEELRVRPVDAGLLPRVAWHCGEPFADPAVLPTFLMSEAAARSVTVALNGDGGDEGFAGYRRHRQLVATRPAQAVPAPLRRALASGLTRAAGGRDGTDWRGRDGRAVLPRAARLAGRLALDPARRYADLLRVFPPGRRGELYGPALAGVVEAHDPQGHLVGAWDAAGGARGWAARTMQTDLTTYLADDLLPKVDLASMAHGLEVRSPLLDHRLLELAARLPAAHLHDKRVLRRIGREWLPPAQAGRPKQGFAVPVGDWLRGDLRRTAEDVLLDPASLERGILRPGGTELLLREHAAGHDRALPLWALLCLELWFRTCVDRPLAAPPAVLA